MFSPNFGHNQSGVWGFFFKMIKNSSLFFLRKLQSYINLHQEDAVSGMLWCVCVCVPVCVSLSYGFTEGGEAKWDPAALQHLTCRKWEGGEWRGGNNMEQLPALHRSGAPVMKPDIFHWWDAFSAKWQHALWCVCSVETFMGRRETGRGWWRPTVPVCSASSTQLQANFVRTEDWLLLYHLLNRPDPSVIRPFIQPSVCLLILLTLHRSHSSFFPSVSVSFLCCFLGISHKQTEQLGMTQRFLGK